MRNRHYEYLPARERKLAEQLDGEDFRRKERTRELKSSLRHVYSAMNEVKEDGFVYAELAEIEENILEVLNKYN